MKIKITSDSTCDLSAELLQKNDISLFPLTVIKDDKAYSDGITITTDEIFAHVAAGGDLCTTTAGSMGEYMDLFTKYASNNDAVIHISLSSELSSSYQNACLAADEFTNVTVIDSRNLSTGQGLVVLKACEMAKSGASVEEIKETVTAYTEKVEASFLLDQLGYMVKGGRCSAVAALGANLLGLKPCIEVKGGRCSTVAALGANLLNLKPCIEVKNGKLGVVKKYRGNYAKCLSSYVKERLADRDDLDKNTLFVTHTPVTDDCLQAVKNAVDACADFENIYWTKAGCTISCHCGPGTLGVLFVKK